MPDISRIDFIASRIERLVFDDGDIQGHAHKVVTDTLGLEWEFGSHDEDEQDVRYQLYWEIYTQVLVQALTRVAGRARLFERDGGDVAV